AIKEAQPFFELFARVIGTSIEIIVGAIGALIGAFLKVLPAVIGVFTGIFQVVGGITKLIQAIFTGQWGKIPGIVGAILKGLLWTVTNGFGAIFGFIANRAQSLLSNVLGAFGFMTKGMDAAHKQQEQKAKLHSLEMQQIEVEKGIKTLDAQRLSLIKKQ